MTDPHGYSISTKQPTQPNTNTDVPQEASSGSGTYSVNGSEQVVTPSTVSTQAPSSTALLPGDDDPSDLERVERVWAESQSGNKTVSPRQDCGNPPVRPPELKDLAAKIEKLESQRKNIWKNAVAGAAGGALVVGGALAVAGAAASVEIGSLPGFVAGGIGGGIVGGIVGFCAGAYRAYRHNKELDQKIQAAQTTIDEECKRFDQTIEKLHRAGVHIGQKEVERLSTFEPDEWGDLLSLAEVDDESDRPKIRQAVISQFLEHGAVSANGLKEKLITASNRNTLDFLLGAQSLTGAPREQVNQFLKDFAHVIGSEQLWSTPHPHSGKFLDYSAQTRRVLGREMMLGALRRLQDPAYKLTKKDRWQINTALSKEDAFEQQEVIGRDAIGKPMSSERALQLTDKMQRRFYGDILISSEKGEELVDRYEKAETLNEKLNIIEQTMSLNENLTEKRVIEGLQELAAEANLLDMERHLTRPAAPMDTESRRASASSTRSKMI